MCKSIVNNMCEWNHEKGMSLNAVVLDLPDWCDTGKQNRTVCVDKCIVHVIKHLWNNRIETLSNCCGHNIKKFGKPSIVIASGYNDAEISKIIRLIREVDDREFEIQQWRIQVVNKKEKFKINGDEIIICDDEGNELMQIHISSIYDKFFF